MRFNNIAKHFVGLAVSMSLASCTQGEITLLVGTYTGAGSEGIYAYRFDQNSGKFASGEALGFAEIENPSFLTISDANIVYAITEKGGDEGSLTSFRYNPKDYTFSKLATVRTIGTDPCYVSTSDSLVAVGNYSLGSLDIFAISENGAAMNGVVAVRGEANGLNQRQSSPHVHCAVFSPEGKYIIASDFSADRLIRYEISTGAVAYIPVDPLSGPRHVCFSPNGKYLYALGELSGDVTVFDYDGYLTKKQVVKADKVDAHGAADIHISPDGRFLYASLRLQNDGIAIFSIAEDGTLVDAGYTNTGKHPRNFSITPNGKFLLCACRDTNEVEVYSIDKATGMLSKTNESISLSKPVCLVWAED